MKVYSLLEYIDSFQARRRKTCMAEMVQLVSTCTVPVVLQAVDVC